MLATRATRQQAWSQAGGVVEDVVDAGRRATKSVRNRSRRPLMVALIGFALGYVASLWIQVGRQTGKDR